MTDNENQTQTCGAPCPAPNAGTCTQPAGHQRRHANVLGTWDQTPTTPLQETSDRVTATLEAEQRAARADPTASSLAQAVLDAGNQVLAAEAEVARVREQRNRLEFRATLKDAALDKWRTTARGLLGADVTPTPDQLAAYVEGLVTALDQRPVTPQEDEDPFMCDVKHPYLMARCTHDHGHVGYHLHTSGLHPTGLSWPTSPAAPARLATTEARTDEWIADQENARHLDGPLRKAAVALSELIDHRFAQAGIPQGPDPESACSCGAAEVCDTLGDES